MALQIPLRKSNLGQNSISFFGPSIWNKLSNDQILNAAISTTHNYKNVVLNKLERVEHNFNHKYYHYYLYQNLLLNRYFHCYHYYYYYYYYYYHHHHHHHYYYY